MKKWTTIAVMGVVAVTMLAGCGATETENKAAGHDHSQLTAAQPTLGKNQVRLPNGDIQETTSSIDELPSFLMNANQQVKLAYTTAAKHNELLKSIPCYCGCGISAGHNHNGNCFIKEIKSDGSVVWDDHGTRCDTCINIAITSASLKEKGRSVKEIRQFIDNAYKEGYAKPTPTPMPS
jgi:outer membrane murein-binding lipoprotein Lpp